MSIFLSKAILDFFIAFGIVVGGAMVGGVGAVLSMQPPTLTMLDIAGRIKIWALAAAVGGTIDPMFWLKSDLTLESTKMKKSGCLKPIQNPAGLSSVTLPFESKEKRRLNIFLSTACISAGSTGGNDS